MKTIKQLRTCRAISHDKLICNTPDKHGTASGRRVRLTSTLSMALSACSWKGYVREVQLNKKGYDRGGAYWGMSASAGPLYIVHAVFLVEDLISAGFNVKADDFYFEASEGKAVYVDYFRGERSDVIAQVRDRYPFAQFSGS